MTIQWLTVTVMLLFQPSSPDSAGLDCELRTLRRELASLRQQRHARRSTSRTMQMTLRTWRIEPSRWA